MRNVTIARNYAEALLALARKANDLDGWGAMIGGLSDAVQGDERLANFLAAPQVSSADKKRVLDLALSGSLPRPLVLFLQKLVDNRRQMFIPEIAAEYSTLVDEHAGRLHAQVIVARETSDADRAAIAAQLSAKLGKTVVPHLHVNPNIIGGVVVKFGDTVMDGSVRKRIAVLRGRLVAGH